VKARFIYEALEFERGLDPKKSMSIGRYWSKTKREIATEIIKRCETELEDAIHDVHAKARMQGYKDSYDYIAKAYNERGGQNLDMVVENVIGDLAAEIKKILEEYPIQAGREDNVTGELTNFFVAGEPPFGTLVSLIEGHLDQKLKESVYFERGIDPKRSMDIGQAYFTWEKPIESPLTEVFKRNQSPIKSLGIGQKALKKKLIEIIPDLSKNILWDEMYKNILTGINLQDTTVSINDKYIIIKTPRLTWRFADNLRLMLNMSPTKVELEKKPSREYIYLRDSDWLKNFKTPRVYKYRIL